MPPSIVVYFFLREVTYHNLGVTALFLSENRVLPEWSADEIPIANIYQKVRLHGLLVNHFIENFCVGIKALVSWLDPELNRHLAL